MATKYAAKRVLVDDSVSTPVPGLKLVLVLQALSNATTAAAKATRRLATRGRPERTAVIEGFPLIS